MERCILTDFSNIVDFENEKTFYNKKILVLKKENIKTINKVANEFDNNILLVPILNKEYSSFNEEQLKIILQKQGVNNMPIKTLNNFEILKYLNKTKFGKFIETIYTTGITNKQYRILNEYNTGCYITDIDENYDNVKLNSFSGRKIKQNKRPIFSDPVAPGTTAKVLSTDKAYMIRISGYNFTVNTKAPSVLSNAVGRIILPPEGSLDLGVTCEGNHELIRRIGNAIFNLFRRHRLPMNFVHFINDRNFRSYIEIIEDDLRKESAIKNYESFKAGLDPFEDAYVTHMRSRNITTTSGTISNKPFEGSGISWESTSDKDYDVNEIDKHMEVLRKNIIDKYKKDNF